MMMCGGVMIDKYAGKGHYHISLESPLLANTIMRNKDEEEKGRRRRNIKKQQTTEEILAFTRLFADYFI